MTRIERFLGRPKKVIIGGEEVEIKPLTIKNLDIIMDMGDPEKKAEATKKLLVTTLEKSFPDDKDKIEDFSLEFMEELMNAILKVNNIEVDEETKKKALSKVAK